jgi:hypothetical protein
MIGVVRILALLAGVAVAGCQTDGLTGSEAGGAKPRVIDTPKTTPRPTASKKDPPSVAQGDVSVRGGPARDDQEAARTQPMTAANTASSASAGNDTTAIPAQSLFGNWILVDNGGRKCRLILGGVLIGAAYSARGEPDCPHAFTTVQSWEIQGSDLILRSPRGIVGR